MYAKEENGKYIEVQGNGFTKRTYLSAGSVLTGSLGAGGAKSTINTADATAGGDSTIHGSGS